METKKADYLVKDINSRYIRLQLISITKSTGKRIHVAKPIIADYESELIDKINNICVNDYVKVSLVKITEDGKKASENESGIWGFKTVEFFNK